MNREIKFRGKRIDNGEWVCGGYAENDGKAFIVVRTRYIPDTRDWDTVEYYENNPCYHLTMIDVDPDTVGQYIGVDDKNGRKIFENDFVSCRQYIGGNWVEYCIERGYVEMKHGAFGLHRKQGYYRPFKDWLEDYEYEVIDNIFDNPELLQNNQEFDD